MGAACRKLRQPWRKPRLALDEWRWSIQEALSIAVAAIPSRIELLDSAFGGNSRWIVPAACTVIDQTAGASTIRMMDRFLGTLIAGAWIAAAFAVTVGIDVNPAEAHAWWILLILWLLVAMTGPLAGWVRQRWPGHPVMSVTVVYTAPVLLGGGLRAGRPLEQCMWRTVCVLTGVAVSGVVTRFVFAKRARTDIIVGLAKIVDTLARSLEPLVELESGLVVSESFFATGRKHSGGLFDMSPTHTELRTDLPQVNAHKVVVSAAAWAGFKTRLMSELDSCGKLISAQLALQSAARKELSTRTYFQIAEHQDALQQIRTLFYHVTSLFTIIETHTQSENETLLAQTELMSDVAHWTRFGVVSISSSPQKSLSAVSASSLLSDLPPSRDSASRGGSTPINIATGEPAVVVTEALGGNELMEADVRPTVEWAKMYGPVIGHVIRGLCAALTLAARGLRQNIHYPEITQHMAAGATAIADFHRRREERRHATAIGIDVLLRSSGDLDREGFLLRLDEVLGISPEKYRTLSDQGKQTFWSSYWLIRERISSTDLYLTTLFVQASKTVAAIDALIQARQTQVADGRKLQDSVDSTKMQLASQAAIVKAGGAGTHYRVTQLN